MSRGDRRPRADGGLADLPIRQPEPALPQDSENEEPANLSLFEQPAEDEDSVEEPADPDLERRREQASMFFEDRAPLAEAPEAAELSAESQAVHPVAESPDDSSREPISAGDRAEAMLAATEETAPAAADHLLAAAADGLVHLAVVSLGVLTMTLLNLEPALDQWPGFLSFCLVFSLLYFTLPLAFWGHSPGMAWRRLRARDRHARPLTFGQTALRFISAWLSLGLLGLPLLAAFTGSTLADRLSRSVTTYRLPPEPRADQA